VMATRKKTGPSTGRAAAKSSRRSGVVRTVRRRAKPAEPEPTPAARGGGAAPGGAWNGTRAAPPARLATPPHGASPPARAAGDAPVVRAGPRPVVVARGDDAIRVFSETLKHSGFFETIEAAQVKSGKRRELFEVSCKVDFMRGVRAEAEPVSYVDPRLVTHLFNELLDRGFRILRVVEVRNEIGRYLARRSVKEVGRALGFDESCYELKDLADELVPVELGTQLGRRATGRFWRQADFRVVFAKNRTDECFGPALALWNVWHTLATPTDLVAMEYGVDPGDFVIAMLEKLPVQFALIDAIHSRDGSPGGTFPYELLRGADGGGPEGAQVHRLGTVIAGTDLLAVEAAGHKMQGLDPLADPIVLQKLRKATGWKPPAEVDALPAFPGWSGIGTRIRDALADGKPAERTRLSLLASLSQADGRLFPPLASGWQAIRLGDSVDTMLEEVRRRRGAAVGAAAAPERAEGDDDAGEDDGPTFP